MGCGTQVGREGVTHSSGSEENLAMVLHPSFMMCVFSLTLSRPDLTFNLRCLPRQRKVQSREEVIMVPFPADDEPQSENVFPGRDSSPAPNERSLLVSHSS